MSDKTLNFVKRIVPLAIIYGGLGFFLANTNPRSLPLPLIIVPFALIMGGLYIPLKMLVELFIKGTGGYMKGVINDRRIKAIALISSAVPTFLLILSSINQLTVKDVLLSIVLIVGLVFYINRSKFVSG